MKIISRILFFFLLLIGSFSSYAQDNEVIRNYIESYKELAISEMQRTGVPASIKLAQGIHETMAGTSVLVTKSNNHFGIKCKSNWAGESVSHDDDARGECFRKYPSVQDSYRDHSNFLKGSQRYASLFDLDPVDYAAWAYGLKKAGYATNPRYPVIIIKLIEDYHLQDYTLIALGKMPSGDMATAKIMMSEKNEQPEPITAIIKTEEPAVEKISYPAGEFRINETRVVFVKKGTSFLSIARQYDISLGRLFDFNEMKEEETATADQLVYLQRKRKTGSDDFHIVKPGETLRDIAQQQGIRLESLLEYNLLKAGMEPAPGERLALRGKSMAMPRLASKTNDSMTTPDRRWSTN